MIKKKTNILIALLFINPLICMGQQSVSVSTDGPKLLWEKGFKEKLLSVVMSQNGEYIAVTDESGYLRYFDKSGKELWQFQYEGKLETRQDYKIDKPQSVITRISVSADGKYIVGVLRGLYTWIQQVEDIETRVKSKAKFETYWPVKTVYFNNEGKLLWEHKALGTPRINDKGDYVFIEPLPDENGEPEDSYYLIDKSGKVLFSKKDMTINRRGFNSGISGDGKYYFIRNVIYDMKRNLVKEFDKSDNVVSISKNNIAVIKYVEDDPADTAVEFRLYDNNMKKIFSINSSTLSYREKEYYFRSYELSADYFILPYRKSCPRFSRPCERGWTAYSNKNGKEVSKFSYRSKGGLRPVLITANQKYLMARNGRDRQIMFFKISNAKQLWRITMPEKFYSGMWPYTSFAASNDGKSFLGVFEKKINFYDNSKYAQ